MFKKIKLSVSVLTMFFPSLLLADGIVSTIVNAPLSATGTVKNSRADINVYLQSEYATGIDFMDPSVVGFGVPAGGRLEVEMGGDFKRDRRIGLNHSSIMLVTGAPQQGLTGKQQGYRVEEGENENTFTVIPTEPTGLVAEELISSAPGTRFDPVINRGIKVIHIGFVQNPFLNKGGSGTVSVRILDGNGSIVHSGNGSIDFLEAPVPQLLPNNFPDDRRNHNWQTIKPGETLGQADGTLPLTYMVFDRATSRRTAALYAFKEGIENIGVLSTKELAAVKFERPVSMARYDGGLVIQDTDSDGSLDPFKDKIIGGVISNAPPGATGQEIRSITDKHGKPILSVLTENMGEKPGRRWGGSLLTLQFTGGSKPGKYRPTVELMKDPDNPSAGDGSSFTYTIVVK